MQSLETTTQQWSLTSLQKQAVKLLSLGTFLEYFDLMLYVHMAVLLNDLFFPKYDPFTILLLSALTFCSTFILRPIAALIFGQIGDKVGRKALVVITTLLMSVSCIIMAILPTYAQIGIAASWLLTICRMLQGLSSMGEIIGAEIYLTEFIKPPIQYPTVMIIAMAAIIGGIIALGIAFITTRYMFNWRIAFWVGAGIALVGGIARTTLKETNDFVNAKLQLKNAFDKANLNIIKLKDNYISHEKIDKKKTVAFFFIQCAWPTCFYFIYIHCGNILKNNFNYTGEQVINQNLIISILSLLGYLVVFYFSYKIHPLKILKVKAIVFLPFALFSPYIFAKVSSPYHVFLIQTFLVFNTLCINPANPIFFSYFPIFKRFTCVIFIYAISRVFMHIVTSFGMIFCEKYFGNWGFMIILLPTAIAYGLGVSYFIRLEKNAGNYLDPRKNPDQQPTLSYV